MREESLSDAVGDQQRAAEAKVAQWEANLNAWQREHANANVQLEQVRASKPLWKRLLAVPTPEQQAAQSRVIQAQNAANQARYGMWGASNVVRQVEAGSHGENSVARGLSGLSDEWVIMRGYRNRRGEADIVLVGPPGVWVIEVKNTPVRITIDGDQWWYEKLDSWGNVVQTGWATDRSGRSWARQVNDVAGDLSTWLTRSSATAVVSTAVVLAHERAELGKLSNLTVNVSIGSQWLLEQVWKQRRTLNAIQCRQIIDLIRRDHQYHASRREHRRK